MKNKIKSMISAVAVLVLSAPALVSAQLANPTGTGLPEASIMKIITTIMNWLLTLVGIVGVIGFAISGILYLTAAGDDTRIGQAKKAMTFSIIGIIVAMVGLVALTAVKSMLGGQSGF